MQGRADVPLSDEGRLQVRQWQLPVSLASASVHTSPLARAVETALLLGASDPLADPGLIEMDWGDWEGETLAGLRATYGAGFLRNADQGLDFRAPRGESPREVRTRVEAWFATIASRLIGRRRHPHGVIRAALTLVTGWEYVKPRYGSTTPCT
jgi:probable phosphoglycerate mutase